MDGFRGVVLSRVGLADGRTGSTGWFPFPLLLVPKLLSVPVGLPDGVNVFPEGFFSSTGRLNGDVVGWD